jgi:hypothetical protein
MKHLLLALLAIAACGVHAAPYPLGTMTCDDIGAFASEAMRWRKSYVSHEEARMKLDQRDYGDPVEKKNLTIILDLVYGNYGNNWATSCDPTASRAVISKGLDQ